MVLVKTTPPFSNWPTTCLPRASKASSKEQVEAELGDDLEAYIRASIDRQNVAEETRLRNEPDLPEVK